MSDNAQPDAEPVGEDAEPDTAPAPRTNQPGRAIVAVVEVLGAVALGLAARWAWQHGTVPIPLPAAAGVTGVVTRTIGSWIALAILAGTVGALLVLDALRQVMLAIGTRSRPPQASRAASNQE